MAPYGASANAQNGTHAVRSGAVKVQCGLQSRKGAPGKNAQNAAREKDPSPNRATDHKRNTKRSAPTAPPANAVPLLMCTHRPAQREQLPLRSGDCNRCRHSSHLPRANTQH